MRPSLAEQMYVAFRSNSPDPASLPAWGNLDTDSRIAWAAAADRAEKVVIEQCAEKLGEAVMKRIVPDSDSAVCSAAESAVAWAAQHLRGHV